jgi:hypothetical protein
VCSRFKVDPRRLYEVLDGDDHGEARQQFLEWLQTNHLELYEVLRKQLKWRREMVPPTPMPLFD